MLFGLTLISVELLLERIYLYGIYPFVCQAPCRCCFLLLFFFSLSSPTVSFSFFINRCFFLFSPKTHISSLSTIYSIYQTFVRIIIFFFSLSFSSDTKTIRKWKRRRRRGLTFNGRRSTKETTSTTTTNRPRRRRRRRRRKRRTTIKTNEFHLVDSTRFLSSENIQLDCHFSLLIKERNIIQHRYLFAFLHFCTTRKTKRKKRKKRNTFLL